MFADVEIIRIERRAEKSVIAPCVSVPDVSDDVIDNRFVSLCRFARPFGKVLFVLFLLLGRQVFSVVDEVRNSVCGFVPIQQKIRIVFGMFLVRVFRADPFAVVVGIKTVRIRTARAVFVFQKDGKLFDSRIGFIAL